MEVLPPATKAAGAEVLATAAEMEETAPPLLGEMAAVGVVLAKMVQMELPSRVAPEENQTLEE
jgi:hypothetical protein